jgi:hypothetical protein
MDSIIQQRKQKCFLCGGGLGIEHLDRHHIFFGALRSKSEQYGLVVYLHHSKCHIFGDNAVHRNAKVNRRLQAFAQRKAMEHYGWDIDTFRSIFHKNYL